MIVALIAIVTIGCVEPSLVERSAQHAVAVFGDYLVILSLNYDVYFRWTDFSWETFPEGKISSKSHCRVPVSIS